jgi:hypothetical protein
MVKKTKLLLILLTIYYSLFTLLNAANVKANVNTVEVVKGNPVTLRIKATGGSAEFPQFLMIGDVPVVGQSSSSSRNLSMINGKVTSEQSVTKVIQFIPEHNMTIPSYSISIDGRKYDTRTIDIKVLKVSRATNTANGLFSLEMRASKAKVMVGESFMLTVYFSLRNDVRLSQEVQYTQPDLSDFIAVQDKDPSAYVQGDYQVQEVRYIVTAQREGNFTITPANARVALPDRSRRDIFGMNFGSVWKQALSNTLNVEVSAQKEESDLIGDFTIDTKIDAQEVKANKPVNLTIKIEGKGNLESFEFPKYEIDGVTIYSDESKVDTKIVAGELYSIYSKSFAFISENDFIIPERSFTMLSTKDQKIKELRVKDYSIKIKKSTASSTMTNANGVVQTQITQKPVKSKEVGTQNAVEIKSTAWWMLVLAFVFGALFMYVLRFLPKSKLGGSNPYKESEALKVLYAHMSEDAEVEEMVRKLYSKKNGDKSVHIDKKRLKEMVERFR